jgi:FMN phosphatase YigB (HAD superfamily)
MLTHILFDFFGTLVTYSPNHIGQDYGRSYHLLVEQGVGLTYESFVQEWDETAVYVGDSYTADYLGATGAGLAYENL